MKRIAAKLAPLALAGVMALQLYHRRSTVLAPPGFRLWLVFLAWVELFVFPLRTSDWFAWTVDPPMTAVFLGAASFYATYLLIRGHLHL